MATTPTKPKLNAAERKAQVAKAEAETKKHVKAFNGYRLAHDKAAAAKRNGEAVEPHVAAKEKQRKGHNLYMAAYTRRKRLLKAT
jgi:hypothetical protein